MFYAHLKQSGGCDYTIACGEQLVLVSKATTVEEAKAWVLAEYGDSIGCGNERELSSITLFETPGPVSIDLKAVIAEQKRVEAATEKRALEQAERIELNRLKSKYEAQP